jgi:hypothetical protein
MIPDKLSLVLTRQGRAARQHVDPQFFQDATRPGDEGQQPIAKAA